MTIAERPDTDPQTVIGYFDTLSNWGRWGADDRLGTLNLITEDKRREAGAEIREGKVVSLSRDIDPEKADPLYTGIAVVQRFMSIGEVSHHLGEGTSRFDAVTEYVGIAAHGSNTHLDGLAHYVWDGMIYNGHEAAKTVTSIGGSQALSVRDAEHGLISRGVLLDIPALRDVPWLEPGHAITAEELEEAERRQSVTVGPGDILLVHTGHVARTLAHGVIRGSSGPAMQAGLHASCLPWLRERDIAALGSDAIQDVQPSGFDDLSLLRPIHAVGLVALGLWLIDNVELRELVTECRARDRWDFFFAMLPWRLVGVTSSATNPVAIF
ncbi:cyclase family protein [Catenulispora rubra]|uniref:cyclase family protein n=1 Tax=Catenulispora rubra TaxID=280293 RepID=UPI00189205A2|nr:cyclase family protein [Catenulispora rubra]